MSLDSNLDLFIMPNVKAIKTYKIQPIFEKFSEESMKSPKNNEMLLLIFQAHTSIHIFLLVLALAGTTGAIYYISIWLFGKGFFLF